MALAIDEDDPQREPDEEGSDYEGPYLAGNGEGDSQMDADEGEGEEEDEDEDEDDEAEEDEEEDEDDEEDGDDDGEEDDDDDDDDDEDDDEEEEEEEEDEDDEAMDVDDADAPQRQGSSTRSLSPTSYLDKVEARRAGIKPASDLIDANAYSIEPVAALPHASHAHAMCLSADGTVLLTGGSDGHVRRYDVYGTMNGKSMLTVGARHGFVEGITKGGVLVSWWANEEHPAVKAEDDSYDERLVSAVHSLAIQQDALWALSGTESGNINLSTVRHDPGTTHHILRKHKGPVSALTLTNGSADLVSGGWDTGVHQWDLNTGQIVRSFPGHAGQISSLSFRPLNRGESSSRRASPAISISMSGPKRGSPRPAAEGSSANGDLQISPDSVSGRSSRKSVQEDDEDTEKMSPIQKTPTIDEYTAPLEGIADKITAPIDIEVDQEEPMSLSAAPLILADEPTATGTPSAGLKTDVYDMGGNFTPTADDLAFEEELQKSLALDGLSESNTKALGGADSKGGDIHTHSISDGVTSTRAANRSEAEGDNDNDSLFGGGSDEDGDVDAEGEEEDEEHDDEDDVDAEGEQDDDDDDDQPLSRTARALRAAEINGDNDAAAAAASITTTGIKLPDLPGNDFSSASRSSALPLPQAGKPIAPQSNGKHADGTSEGPSSSQKALKTPAWGGLTTTEGYDADTTQFSNDLLLTTTLGGQAILWDRRVSPSENNGGSSGSGSGNSNHNGRGGVRALPLPAYTPPWCASAIWAPDGERIYLGRRNESVEEWDMRMLSSSTASGTNGASSGDGGGGGSSSSNSGAGMGPTWSGRRGNLGLVRTIRFPSGSGPVTSLAMMPNGRHLVCASFDNIRLWNLSLSASSNSSSNTLTANLNPTSTTSSSSSSSHIPFRIVPGHQGGTVSSLLLDPTGRFLFSASGDRAWRSRGTEMVLGHEVRTSG